MLQLIVKRGAAGGGFESSVIQKAELSLIPWELLPLSRHYNV
jgi:hypothetical protein